MEVAHHELIHLQSPFRFFNSRQLAGTNDVRTERDQIADYLFAFTAHPSQAIGTRNLMIALYLMQALDRVARLVAID